MTFAVILIELCLQHFIHLVVLVFVRDAALIALRPAPAAGWWRRRFGFKVVVHIRIAVGPLAAATGLRRTCFARRIVALSTTPAATAATATWPPIFTGLACFAIAGCPPVTGWFGRRALFVIVRGHVAGELVVSELIVPEGFFK
jgi:hypothetical protein